MKYTGRPRKYETAEDMQEIIMDYFKQCEVDKEVPTVTGLGFALGMTREMLLRYENSEEHEHLKNCSIEEKRAFRDTIKRAKQFVESGYEQALFDKNKTIGSIFTLKNNYKWVDKQEVETTNKDITVSIIE